MSGEAKQQLLTPQDVATMLQVKLRAIEHLVQSNRLHGVKIANKWRFTQDDVDNYIESQRIKQAE